MRATFIDTSVLCELLRVPGRCGDHEAIRAEFARREAEGEQFVLPITAVIETGNHIAQARGGRRGAAERLVALVESVRAGEAPFVLCVTEWDEPFLAELCAGDSTHRTFVDLAGDGVMGAGDVAILVERDRFKRRSAFDEVRIWSLDAALAAYS